MAEAAIGAGALLGSAYVQYRSASNAQKQQQRATEQAAQAQREQEAEEKRRYQERWEDYQRQLRDYEARRKAATEQNSGKTYRMGGKPVDAPNTPSQMPQQVPTYGVNPVTGKPRTLGEIATSWNDWGQYGLS